MTSTDPLSEAYVCLTRGHAGCTQGYRDGEIWVTHHPAPTPPADDVREATIRAFAEAAYGTDPIATRADRFLRDFEVRPHGTVTPPVEDFCDQCSGPFDGWLEQYGGHWDTCPNRVATPPADDVREALDLDSLEARARAATSGPWQAFTTGARGGDHWYVVDDSESIAHISANDGRDEDRREVNARHIAAASPDVVLALIARLRAAEVRPRGTVTHAEVRAIQDVVAPEFHGLSYRERLIARCVLEAAAEARRA